jgi:hypothetical protein
MPPIAVEFLGKKSSREGEKKCEKRKKGKGKRSS